jgi:hypothetical protein
MSKYELSLAKDYVPGWDIVDAVRELFQNALDQQATVEGNDMFFDYDEEKQLLSIGNKLSVLNTKTLLLGSSTKRDDDKTIGKFGEGYKIATLVLTRLGKKVVFYNYGSREVWYPRFVNSRRYGAEILTFFVDKKFPWFAAPDNNLTITVEGVTLEEYESIKLSNLHLTKPVTYYETEFGRILIDSKLKGKVFVNGLYVTDYDQYVYGYDFKPAHIELDRDRKLVNDFNLKWLASKMWNNPSDEMAEVAAELAKVGAADVAYVSQVYLPKSNIKEIANKAFTAFKREHGENAVPVTSTYELEKLPKQYKPVIVKEPFKDVLKKSDEYKEPERIIEPTLLEKVEKWLDTWQGKMHPTGAEEMRNIIKAEKGEIIEEEKDNGESEELPF